MISFEPTEDELALQQTVRRFAAERIRPAMRESEEANGVSDNLTRAFWDLGLAQMSCPISVGGAGLGWRSVVLAEEELACGDAGVTAGLSRPGLTGEVLSGLGQDIQERWLAPLVGQPPQEAVAAIIDADGAGGPNGCDAVPCNGDVVVKGTKVQVAAADRADWILVAARRRGEPVLLMVSRRTPGVEFAPATLRLGLRAARYGRLELRQCRVPGEAVVAAGEAATTALARAMRRELVVWSARAVGTARAAFEHAARYATERRTFGRSIAEHQAVAFMIADAGILTDAARALVWQAAWALDTEALEIGTVLASAARTAAEVVVSVTNDCVQILGGHGYVQDHPVEKWMRDGRALANLIQATERVLQSLVSV